MATHLHSHRGGKEGLQILGIGQREPGFLQEDECNSTPRAAQSKGMWKEVSRKGDGREAWRPLAGAQECPLFSLHFLEEASENF